MYAIFRRYLRGRVSISGKRMAQVSIPGSLVEQSRRGFGEGPSRVMVLKEHHGAIAQPAEGRIGQAVALVSRGKSLLDVGVGLYCWWDVDGRLLLFRSGVDAG